MFASWICLSWDGRQRAAREIPYIWLTVCYDKIGDYDKAYYYHKQARMLEPDNSSVVSNQKYFERLGYN